MIESPRTILVVEDEKSLLKTWVDRFRKEGLNVLAARNCDGALALAQKFHPDLVVVDLVMPSSDGLVLINKLRQDRWGTNVPVMFLSGWLQGGNLESPKACPPEGAWSLDRVVEKVKKKLKTADSLKFGQTPELSQI